MASETFVANATGQQLNCDLTDALTNWSIAVSNGDQAGFTVLATGRSGTPTAGRSVQLVYTRTGQPAWTEN